MPGKEVMKKCSDCGFDNRKTKYQTCPKCRKCLIIKKPKNKNNGHRVPPRTRIYKQFVVGSVDKNC